MTEPSM